MKKILILLSTIFLLNGCAESLALLGPSAANGKFVQSSLNSAISYGVKKGLYPEFDKKLRQEWRKKPNETNLKKVFDSLKSEGFSLSEEKFKELMTSQEGNSDEEGGRAQESS